MSFIRDWRIIPISLAFILIGVLIFVFMASFLFAKFASYQFTPFLWFGALVYQVNFLMLVLSGVAAFFMGIMPVLAYWKSLFKQRALYGAARFASLREMKQQGLFKAGADKIIIGRYGKRYLYYQGSLHPFLAAPTGSGKGVGYVIPNLLNWNGSVVITDMKKEAWHYTSGYRSQVLKQPCYFFDPLNDHQQTIRINPLDYVRVGTPHRVSDVGIVADTLVTDSEGGDGNQWTMFARKLFTSLGLLVLEAGHDLGWPGTVGQIYRLINADIDLTEVIQQSMADMAAQGKSLSDECRGALLAFTRQPEKQREGIVATLDSALQLWQSPLVDYATSASDIDLTTLRKQPQSLYLVSNNSDLHKLRFLFRLIFQTLINTNTAQNKDDHPELNVPLFLLMDEFLSLGKMPLMVHAMSYVRGYGIRLSPVLQSPSQLTSMYGLSDTSTFLENSDVRIIFRPKAESAKAISELLGTMTVKQKSYSKSRGQSKSVNISEQSRPLFFPQELRELPEDRCILFVEGGKPVYAEKIRYYQERHFKDRLLPEASLPECPGAEAKKEAFKTRDKTESELDAMVNEMFQNIVKSLN